MRPAAPCRQARRRFLWLSLIVFVLGMVAPTARADTIVLKNGRRIAAAHVVEENGRVSYDTPAGRFGLPRSIVERIERGVLPAVLPAAQLPLTAPPAEAVQAYSDVARAAVHDAALDTSYIAGLEEAARGGGAEAAARAAAAHRAAAQFELERGDLGQAIAHYRRALFFAPEQLNLLLNVAYLHLRRSEYSAALDYLERARRIAPDSPDQAKLAGWAYYGLNRIEQAVEEWKRAQSLRADAEVERALEKAERDLQEEAGYHEGETRHFVLRYHGGAAPQLARDVLRALEEHFRTIESGLNFTPAESIGVILYTEEAFGDITRAPGWVGALNDGRIRVPVQGLTTVPPELSRVLKHELTHSFIQQKTRGRAPVWLQEGVAEWMEGHRSGEASGMLIAAYDGHTSLPLAALEGTWMNLPGDAAAYAYAWSLGVVEYIVATYGMGDLERVLERITSENSTEAAARGVLRMDYADLERETVKYLRRTYRR